MDLGLWQKEVATLIGVDEMTIVNWEKNRRTPTLRSLSKFIEFLGYDPRPEGQTIGEKLRHNREARSISAAELAHEWGVDPATVTKYETREDCSHNHISVPKIIGFLGYNVLPSPRTVGEYIRCVRYAAGLNQLELGSLLKVSNHTISEWELDRKMPASLQLDLIEAISTGLPAPFRNPCPEFLRTLCAGAVRCDRRQRPRSDYPSEPKSLGDHIRKQRLEAGLNQAALARKFGVNRNAVTNWEADLQEPGLDKMPELVTFIGRDALPGCQTLANRIRVERRSAGLTQNELAGLLGVSRETVNLWESGKRVPKGKHLEHVRIFLTHQIQ